MKKNTLFAIIIMALATLGCKKDNTSSKDITTLFKNTVWTGEFNYTGKAKEPVNIEFKESGQFTWYELSGEYAGTWKIENGKISVSFPSGSGFKAGISNDNKLTNIQNLAVNSWAMDNANLNSTADIVLDNTVWKGPAFVFHFRPGALVDVDIAGSMTYLNLSYTRKAKSIRIYEILKGKWFSIITTATTIKGAMQFSGNPNTYYYEQLKQ